MYLDNKRKEDCCGCMACSRVCPVSAIAIRQDPCGFCYPAVDPEKCIDCGLCRKVCPMGKNFVGRDADPDIYAVQNKKKEILAQSSSGGMFSLLADWVLGQDGVIYGAAFDENFMVRHMRAVSGEEAESFRTSKYVESDLTEVYEQIRQDLTDARTVLLTGTPCQIAGVTGYLKAKRVNTEKLYTCDNICHGVPSAKVWKDYLKILKDKYIAEDDEIVHINMRSKKVSWKEKNLEIQLKKGNIDAQVKKLSFNDLFASLVTQRPSCFYCHYTSYLRPSDFTLGDFWNADNTKLGFDTEQGVNVVLVNTTKAKELFENLREGAYVQPVSKADAWQPHLEYSAQKPAGRERFWKEYLETQDQEPVIQKYVKGSLLTRLIRILSPVLRKTGLYNLAGRLYQIVFVRGKK